MQYSVEMDDFHCSFCGKRRREVRKLISGPRVFICDECVALCNDILAKEEAAERPRYPRPKEIYDELHKYVVGQDNAKKALAEGFLPILERVSTFLKNKLADPAVLAQIRSFGQGLADAFDKVLSFAQKVPWE